MRGDVGLRKAMNTRVQGEVLLAELGTAQGARARQGSSDRGFC